MILRWLRTAFITYHVYDCDRVDGNERELHNDIALAAFDLGMPDNFRVNYNTDSTSSERLVSCPYFTTTVIDLKGTVSKENLYDSFMIYMCIEGNATLNVNWYITKLLVGETVLIPACIETFSISANHAKLLEVYI